MINSKSTKNAQLKIRLTRDEYAGFKLMAEKQGKTLANLAREKLNLEAVNRTPLSSKSQRSYTKADPQLIREIARIGNNLNQLARKANQSGMSDLEDFIITLINIERSLKRVLHAHKIF